MPRCLTSPLRDDALLPPMKGIPQYGCRPIAWSWGREQAQPPLLRFSQTFLWPMWTFFDFKVSFGTMAYTLRICHHDLLDPTATTKSMAMTVSISSLHPILKRSLAVMIALFAALGASDSAQANLGAGQQRGSAKAYEPVAKDEKVVQLLKATRDGDIAIAKTLLDNGQDVNSRDSDGDAALKLATKSNKGIIGGAGML